jgi:hypothetical protein
MRLSTHPKWGMFKNASPVLKPLEGKATATGTGGAYGGVREQGPGATCLRVEALQRVEAKPRSGEGRERRWRPLRPDSGHAFSTFPPRI